MKTGIIIICYNNEIEIDTDHCVKYLNNVKDIEFCLVNNKSEDNTYDLLKEISETCKNVSVVNVNKHKTDISAVRAGARFMFNQFNLKYLGFINTNMISKYEDLSMLIKAIRDNQVDISKYNQSVLNEKGIKLTMFQSLFPVMDYLAKNNVKNQYSNLKTHG
jgi:glycosyltransferase involved in cell wall biosynthesis